MRRDHTSKPISLSDYFEIVSDHFKVISDNFKTIKSHHFKNNVHWANLIEMVLL